MRKKIKLIIEKHRILILSVLLISLLVVICLMLLFPKNKVTLIKEDYNEIVFQHDSTWKVTSKNNQEIILSHKSGGTIGIQITKLNNDYEYSSIEEIIDELLYGLSKQNNDYKLISKKESVLTKNKYNGYKFLYENDINQVMVVAYKTSDSLVIVIYEAANNYFDILLDSVNNIIYNIEIKRDKVELKDSVKMNISNVEYLQDDEFDKRLTSTTLYQTASNNYLVEYELPSVFKKYLTISSSRGEYQLYDNYDKKIEISVNIYNQHIYELFDSDRINVYSKYKSYHDGSSDKYSDFKESVTKLDNKYEGFIYKNSYKYKTTKIDENYNSQVYEEQNETAIIIYSLSNNYIIEFEIRARDLPITKKLIEMIQIKNVTNYSEYIKIEKEGNYLIGRFKSFTDYNYQKIREITLKIPDKYRESDYLSLQQNIYEKRYYTLNYHKEYDIYDYEVEYTTNKAVNVEKGIKNSIKIINDVYVKETYGKANKLTYSKMITINGKEFYLYEGGYTDRSGILLQNIERKYYYVDEKVLYYKISDTDYLEIIIKGNDKKISSDMFKELTNFTIEEKDL